MTRDLGLDAWLTRAPLRLEVECRSVAGRGQPDVCCEVLAQCCRRPEAAGRGDLVDACVGAFELLLGKLYPLQDEPLADGASCLVAERAGQGALAHAGLASELAKGERLAEVVEHPLANGRGRAPRSLGRNRPAYILRLAALSPGRHDARPRHLRGHDAAVVVADQLEAQVDGGAPAR